MLTVSEHPHGTAKSLASVRREATVAQAVAPLAGVAGALLMLACCAGCSDPLLGPKDERSPFDRYDAVRNQYAPQYIEDKFGRRQPNLSGRLGPKD